MYPQWPYFYPYSPDLYQQFPFKHESTFQQKSQTTVPVKQKIESEKQIEYKEKQKDMTWNILEHIQKIYEKLNEMEEKQKQLKEEIDNLSPVTIENINYKIQDLNVQDLSGNLLVGLTALSDAEKLQELLRENGAVTFNDMDTDQFVNQMTGEEQENNSPNQEE